MKEKKVWVGYEIHRLDNAIKKKIDNKLRSDGLDEATMCNGWVLKYLYDNKDKEVYQKDIAELHKHPYHPAYYRLSYPLF